MVYLKRHIRGVYVHLSMLMGLAKVSIQISCSNCDDIIRYPSTHIQAEISKILDLFQEMFDPFTA